MPRKPKKLSETKSNGFLSALQFVSLIMKDVGPIHETHINIRDGWITAFNGVLGIGCRISEDLTACPHNKLITQALLKCGQQFSITQLDNNRLSIKSDKFKAIVPCIDNALLPVTIPDPPIAIIDDRLKQSVEIVSILANENAQTIYGASVLFNGPSVISSLAGRIIFEYWHGIDLPHHVSLPKASAQALSKINKKLVRFGLSNTSVTFWFEDESWLRTQVYAEQWPDVQRVLDKPCHAGPIPADFYLGLDAISAFSDGNCYFDQNVIRSHSDESIGASYDVVGLPRGPIFNIKQLNLIKPYVKSIDFLTDNNSSAMFFGENCRGIIAGHVK